MNTDNSRRTFIKKMSIGSAGITFGGHFINENVFADSLHQETVPLNIGADQFSPVYPVPQKTVYKEGSFRISDSTKILLPFQSSEHDLFLARQLRSELAEKYGIITVMCSAPERLHLRRPSSRPGSPCRRLPGRPWSRRHRPECPTPPRSMRCY